ncbi:MAG TPA: AMP-binding protein, partial [Haliangium sp.]|nr:AMP-binding protein [Haliangium sp.]
MSFQTLVELLRSRADATPERLAIAFSDAAGRVEEHSYEILDRRARAIAALLQARLQPGDRVLLLFAPGLDYVAAFFGCVYAGVIAVPAYPPNLARPQRDLARLAVVADDAEVAAVLTTSPLRQFAKGGLLATMPSLSRPQWLAVDDPGADATAWRPPAQHGEDLAFLQYTSGSTGTPKGVMLSHRNLLANSAAIHAAFRCSETSRGVIWLPPYHDMGLIGGILQPIYGGFPTLLMSPMDFLARPQRWLERVSSFRGTISGGPNFAYELCLRKMTPEERAALDLSTWSVAFTGAEPVRAATLRRFTDAFAGSGFREAAFFPCYGLAEATLIVSGIDAAALPRALAVEPEALQHGRAVAPAPGAPAQHFVSCGRVIDGHALRVVDPGTGVPRPAGEIGEIWIAGPSVAQGYWRNPALTETTFRAAIPGDPQAYLRTGDLGFLDAAGELVITGRRKDLIILRGRNYYPQDFEQTAEAAHPGVRPGCCAAFAVEEDGEEKLALACEIDARRVAHLEDVAPAICAALASEHAVRPAFIALLPQGALPKTSSGKLQRSAGRQALLAGQLDVLLTWRGTQQEQASDAAVPEVDVSGALTPEALAAIVATRLGMSHPTIDPTQALTWYGLDSLQGVELQAELRERHGLDIALDALLGGASAVDLLAAATPAHRAEPSAPADGADHAPTAGQEALWFIESLTRTDGLYNIARAVELDEAAASRLCVALQAAVDRHPALRTRLVAEAGRPRARVDGPAELPWAEVDASGWSPARISAYLVQESYRPFDLAAGPPLRASLLRHGAGACTLLLVVHHTAADFASLSNLALELGGAAVGPAAPYAEFARAEATLLAGPEGERLEAFWQRRLPAPPSPLALPTDRPRPSVRNPATGRIGLRIEPAVAARLGEIARARGVTLVAVLTTGFQVLLRGLTGQDDVWLGVPVSLRTPGHGASVGYYVNLVALRASVRDDLTWTDLLAATQRELADAIAHAAYPFARVVQRLAPHRDLDRAPIVQATFTFLQGSLAATSLAPLALGETGAPVQIGPHVVRPLALDEGRTDVDLAVALAPVEGGGLHGVFEYRRDLFEPATLERWASAYLQFLAALAADPEERLSSLPWPREQVAAASTFGSGGPAADDGLPATLTARLERQAVRTPDAIAVDAPDRNIRLTYAELLAHTHAVAHALRAAGVRAEDRVGVRMERSPEMVIALLGVLASGGAYVPLDPGDPLQRVAYMAADAGVEVLLAQRHLRDGAPAGPRVITLEVGHDGALALDAPAPPSPLPLLDPDQLAYVMYTSGSTGRPKGVAVAHRGLVNRIVWGQQRFALRSDDTVLYKTSFGFDVS